jgi:hypothetical protein
MPAGRLFCKCLTDRRLVIASIRDMTERGDRLDRLVSRLILLSVLVVLVALVWWGSTPR